jgi:iron complex outermembrane receptor protein
MPALANYRARSAGRRRARRTRTAHAPERGRPPHQRTDQRRQRYVAGLTGNGGGWDYDVGYNHSVNTVKDKDTHGYVLYNELLQGIADGLINPFGPSSAAGVPLLDSIQVNDDVRHARGTMDSIDFKARAR